jgi:hypothetical protein
VKFTGNVENVPLGPLAIEVDGATCVGVDVVGVVGCTRAPAIGVPTPCGHATDRVNDRRQPLALKTKPFPA